MKFHRSDTERPPAARARGDNTPSVQSRWNVCCQSLEEHRFDCAEDVEYRGAGPCGPVRAETPAEIIARLRSA